MIAECPSRCAGVACYFDGSAVGNPGNEYGDKCIERPSTITPVEKTSATNQAQFPPNPRPKPSQGFDIKTGDVDSMVNTENKNEATSKVVVNLVVQNRRSVNRF